LKRNLSKSDQIEKNMIRFGQNKILHP